jgi:hypothetical protein
LMLIILWWMMQTLLLSVNQWKSQQIEITIVHLITFLRHLSRAVTKMSHHQQNLVICTVKQGALHMSFYLFTATAQFGFGHLVLPPLSPFIHIVLSYLRSCILSP